MIIISIDSKYRHQYNKTVIHWLWVEYLFNSNPWHKLFPSGYIVPASGRKKDLELFHSHLVNKCILLFDDAVELFSIGRYLQPIKLQEIKTGTKKYSTWYRKHFYRSIIIPAAIYRQKHFENNGNRNYRKNQP